MLAPEKGEKLISREFKRKNDEKWTAHEKNRTKKFRQLMYRKKNRL